MKFFVFNALMLLIQQLWGPHNQLLTTDAEAAASSPYIHTDVREALLDLPSGTMEEPTVLNIEPGVYWIDDPDDPAIRKAEPVGEGRGDGTPYGIVVKCDYLHLKGLADDPQDVVLACNRGQTQGALGNYTMMKLLGNGLEAENITFGNYCNVDLVYPRDPSQNRPRRKKAIVQAQLVHCPDADQVTVRNCRFVSRLNLCPFTGAKSAYFERCHFECTDDALPWTATFQSCHFDLYGDMPFYSTIPSGVKLVDCDVETHVSKMRWVKDGGMVILRNTRIDGTLVENDTVPEVWERLPKQHGKPTNQKLDNLWIDTNAGTLAFGKPKDVRLHTNFYNLDLTNRNSTKPGEWLMGTYKPEELAQYNWQPNPERQAWYYGTGEDGCIGQGLVQAERGARMYYTPRQQGTVKAMKMMLQVDPAKQGGQGFGSATGQYMDVCMKFDASTLTGFALRIERTPDYGNAVVMKLVEYKQGKVTVLTEGVPTSCYRSTCTITLDYRNGVLTAHASTSAGAVERDAEILPEVTLSAHVKDNFMGGAGIQHTGTLGSGASMIHFMEVEWR